MRRSMRMSRVTGFSTSLAAGARVSGLGASCVRVSLSLCLSVSRSLVRSGMFVIGCTLEGVVSRRASDHLESVNFWLEASSVVHWFGIPVIISFERCVFLVPFFWPLVRRPIKDFCSKGMCVRVCALLLCWLLRELSIKIPASNIRGECLYN